MLGAAFAVFVVAVVHQGALILEGAHGYAEPSVHRAHPVGVAPRQIVVDGNYVNAVGL